MKILVCGGRDYKNEEKVFEVLSEYFPFELISGGARGADTLAQNYARVRGLVAHIYYPNWSEHGRVAGIIRNRQMLDKGQPNLVIAFPGGNGTANMIKIAKDAGVEVVEIRDN